MSKEKIVEILKKYSTQFRLMTAAARRAGSYDHAGLYGVMEGLLREIAEVIQHGEEGSEGSGS